MFVRAKTIKGQKYGYLVENKWVKGKVKQISKKYLGRIVPLLPLDKPNNSFKIDFSLSKKEIIAAIISVELSKHGFVKHTRKNALVLDDIEVHLRSGVISKANKKIVLFLNERYIYPNALQNLLDFFQPEDAEERPGTRLAAAFSNIGIPIEPTDFVSLYKKIYLEEN